MPLERQDVVDAAMAISDADGLDKVTVRAIAARLGVQAPTLYWHVRNKAEVLDALADAIVIEALAGLEGIPTDGAWQAWLEQAATVLRRALLSHRDGARIVSSAVGSLGRADFFESALTRLVGERIPLQRARLLVLTVERFTLGYVLEEQTIPDGRRTPDMEELKRRLPLSIEAIVEYYGEGRTADDLFADGIRLIIG